MADLTITAASVIGTGVLEQLTAGGTITAGQPVRRSTGASTVVAASDDSAANADAYGIALNGGAIGQPITVLRSGNINLGATLAVGKVYVLSTSGAICPVDDIAGGEFVTVLGVASTASNLVMGIVKGGVAAAGAVA